MGGVRQRSSDDQCMKKMSKENGRGEIENSEGYYIN